MCRPSFVAANTVRGETDRTSTMVDDVRAYYLATGAIDRAAVELLWAVTYQDPEQRKIKRGATWVDYQFPTGAARVELIPETAKLNVNTIQPERLLRLGSALGLPPAASMQIVQGILSRRLGTAGALSLPTAPTFPQSGASFQEIEELLSVKGVTPEIFYGTYVPNETEQGEPRLVRRNGLVDCLTVYGTSDQVDANTADPAVLAAVGLTPDAIRMLVQTRRQAPLTPERLAQLASVFGPGAVALRLEGNSIITLRATARAKLPNGQLSDMSRTVSALVKYMPPGYPTPIHILRWYDTAWSN